jgi:tetratricopeptide (TPR) repeat protein
LGRVAWSYYDEGNYKKWASLWGKYFNMNYNRNEMQYYFQLAQFNLFAEDSLKAEKYYKEAIRLFPEHVAPKYNLADIYIDFYKDYLTAIQLYKSALEIIPDNPGYIDGIAHCYLKLGNLKEAEKWWLRIYDVERNYVDTLHYYPFRHRLGYVKWLQGDTAKAMKYFNDQIQLDIERAMGRRGFGVPIVFNYGCFYDLAGVYSFLGNKDEAYRWLDSTLNEKYINDWFIINLETDPLFENIRNESRFKDMYLEKRQRYDSIQSINKIAHKELVKEIEKQNL